MTAKIKSRSKKKKTRPLLAGLVGVVLSVAIGTPYSAIIGHNINSMKRDTRGLYQEYDLRLQRSNHSLRERELVTEILITCPERLRYDLMAEFVPFVKPEPYSDLTTPALKLKKARIVDALLRGKLQRVRINNYL